MGNNSSYVRRVISERLAFSQTVRSNMYNYKIRLSQMEVYRLQIAIKLQFIHLKDHPGLINTIFGVIQPKTAVITTPNGDFNAHWPTMPHGNFRHADHRFEWTQAEFQVLILAYPKENTMFLFSVNSIVFS